MRITPVAFGIHVTITQEQQDWLEHMHLVCSNEGMLIPKITAINLSADGTTAGSLEESDLLQLRKMKKNAEIGKLTFLREGIRTLIATAADGEVEYTAALIKLFLKRFAISEIVGIVWATPYEVSRVSGYQSGIAVITKDEIRIHRTSVTGAIQAA